MRKWILLLVGLLFSAVVIAQSGPFGFQRGMTKNQIVALVGLKAVDTKASVGDVLRLKTAPKPETAFETYMLLISPDDGLVGIIAIGRDTRTGDDGAELKSVYDAMLQQLSSRYGGPSQTIDICERAGAACKRSADWMLMLLGRQRRLQSVWRPDVPTKAMRDTGVHVVTLEATATGINSGLITCRFELEGFAKYVASKSPPRPATPEKKTDKGE